MRRYLINNLYNMRDLGGYPTTDGKYTKFSRLIRSDSAKKFTENEINIINDLKITQVIDLRTEKETITKPSEFGKIENIDYYICSFNTGDIAPNEEEDIASGYLAMFEDFETVSRVLNLIAQNAYGGTIYHCAVGKDRTGIISAILLKICNVPIEDILADYQISYTYLKSFVDKLHIEYPSLPEWLGQSKREYMAEAFQLLEEKYGSFEEYLDNLDINNSTIQNIKKILI